LGNLTQLRFAYFPENGCIDESAYGLEKVQELNRKLHIFCPPFEPPSTTTPQTPPTAPPEIDYCPTACSDDMRKMQETINELKNLTYELKERIIELEQNSSRIK
jgi:hypothetical protein